MGFFETAEYHIVEKYKNIEIRDYQTFFVASTKTRFDNRQSGGFNNVFNYISGQNETNEKISMTVPVVTTVEDDQLVTSFVVPKKYYDSIPAPTSNSVYIEKIEEGKFIAIRFSGAWSEHNFQENDRKLLQFISEHNLNVFDKRYVMRYQGPFVPSIMRRNEILYRIKTD